jgi:very-short-patch-repair endonuclease
MQRFGRELDRVYFDRLAPRARAMRTEMTATERAVWELLRKKRLGVRFRRQVVLPNGCIADFYAPSLKLVVEVDGGVHRREGQAIHDRMRDAALRKAGITVIRIDAAAVEAALRRSAGACDDVRFIVGRA